MIVSGEKNTEYLIIGGGTAGLRAAVELLNAGKEVTILAKGATTESNTEHAQGGVAAAISDEDEISLHYEDTIKAGDGLCDEEAVRVLVEEGPGYIEELLNWGVHFDKVGSKLAFTKEGAHSKNRILHAHGDSTGEEVMRVLIKKVKSYDRVEYLPYNFAVELIVNDGICRGAVCVDEKRNEIYRINADGVLMATGGLGVVYRETTNPDIATGDGPAMAFRSGAEIMDMEFVQFHPTVLFLPGVPRFLLSESLRGEGARLKNKKGKRFMKDYHPSAELAPRDIVSRSILRELRKTGSRTVFLDMTHLKADFIRNRFPKIYKTCRKFGIDIAKDQIPVRPCAHYMMGGIKTDLHGRTSLKRLYAAGECACTGVHGANRLASNSLLEGLVYGARSGEAMLEEKSLNKSGQNKIELSEEKKKDLGSEKRRIQKLMWKKVGMMRCEESLKEVLEKSLSMDIDINRICTTRSHCEARNILLNARMITFSALKREESRGGHYRTDYPEKKESRRRHTVISKKTNPELLNG